MNSEQAHSDINNNELEVDAAETSLTPNNRYNARHGNSNSKKSENSIFGPNLEFHLMENSGINRDKIDKFEQIHSEFNNLIEENAKLKRQKEEVKNHLERIENNIRLYQEELSKSKECVEEDQKLFEEALREIDQKQSLIDSYSHEITSLKQENLSYLLNIEQLHQSQESLSQDQLPIETQDQQQIKLQLNTFPEVTEKQIELRKRESLLADYSAQGQECRIKTAAFQKLCRRLKEDNSKLMDQLHSAAVLPSLSAGWAGTKTAERGRHEKLENRSKGELAEVQTLREKRERLREEVQSMQAVANTQGVQKVKQGDLLIVVLVASIVLNLMLVWLFA